jgi:tetratricopeptide (TPR) repeat protein
MTDVLEIEDSISERVTATLVPHLTGDEQRQISKHGTDNAEAYQAYLRGRYFWNQFTPEALPKALEAFEKAVALDPNYAAAYAGIADFYNWATNFGFYPPHDGNEKMRAAVTRALEIDPKLPEALAAMGLIKAFFDYDWTEAERFFRRSVEVNPHLATTYERYAAMLNALGRTDEAGEKAALAGKLDPLSLRTVTLFAWNFYQQRRFADALARADEVIELNPHYFLGRILRGNILVELGRAAEAIPEIKRGIELEPRVPLGYYMLCFAHAALGQMDEAQQTLHDLENLPNAFASAHYLGLCNIALGDRAAAFELLNKAIEARQTLVAYLATDPKFDSIRDDERFNELLRKTNRAHLAKRPN